MFSYLMYSHDTVVYIRVWKTIPRLLYLDERCDSCEGKMNACINDPCHMTRMAVLGYFKKSFSPKKAYKFETWQESSMNGVLQRLSKL